ncbi:DNA alkylation repair protein [Flavobacterium arsenatis]|nr:DNA alkylation repair protein [Flavobacterium arsenatis]
MKSVKIILICGNKNSVVKMSFIKNLEKVFQENSNPEDAVAMENYMKNHFSFYGIKTENRRLIFKTIWKEHQKEVAEKARNIAKELFSKSQRELHYCGIEILMKELKKKYQKEDISLIEFLIVTNSWWDSVDVIAKYLLGEYLIQFPDETEKVIEKFSNSENMWLNRSAILFQLGYKQKTDADLLFALCQKHSDSNEFFIRKAIGWALREYAKTNPSAVIRFVETNNLKPLSEKEALKNIV